jgi:hypothetical protein
MRELILVSKTPIVIQIFNLVCKKLSIHIQVLNDISIDRKVDILVIDKEFIDEDFATLKRYTKQIGAITNDEMSFEMANDFAIPSPFLPSNLEVILQEQLSILAQKANAKTYVTNEMQQKEKDPFIIDDLSDVEADLGLDEELEPAMEYLGSIADDIANGIDEENDDSIVSTVSLDNGGVLDKEELSRIGTLVDLGGNPSLEKLEESIMEDVELNQNSEQWQDLSDIIDQAINEANTSEQFNLKDLENNPIDVKLNDFTLEELKPLLSKLDQDIIDNITEGNAVTLKLRLESN